jgi:hypothetical protein
MAFRISGLPRAAFAPLFALPAAQLARHQARLQIVDRHPGFPCRVSLRDAALGETVLLVNYEHLPVDSPYRSRHAIFVRRDAQEAQLTVNEVPQCLASRLLSVRALDADGMMLDAEVVAGAQLPEVIERLLAPQAVSYLHVHNAKPGCFAARVERA